jgi:hypothetical protein
VRVTTSLRRDLRLQRLGRAFARAWLRPKFGLQFRNSLLAKIISLLRFSSFPVLLLREFRGKCPSQKGFPQREWAQASPSSFFSLYFSLLPGNLKTETGSIATASATNHSPHRRDFRGVAPNTPYWRLPPGQPGLWISRTVLYGRYGRSVSAPKNHLSWETETDLTRDWFESGHPAPSLTAVIRPSRLMGSGLLGFPRSTFRQIGSELTSVIDLAG